MQPDPARATRNESGLRLLGILMLIVIPVNCAQVLLSAYLGPLVPKLALYNAQQVTFFLLLALCIQLVGSSASLGSYVVALLITVSFYLAALQAILVAQSWPLFACPLAFVLLSRWSVVTAPRPAGVGGGGDSFRAVCLVAVLVMIMLADLLALWWQPPLAGLLLGIPTVLLVWRFPRLEDDRRLVITRVIVQTTLLLVVLSLLVGLGQLVGLPRGLVALFCCYLSTVGGSPTFSARDRLGLWLTLVFLLLCCSYYLASATVPDSLSWTLTLGSLACLLGAILALWLLPRQRRLARL
ncbi:hypothetical protein [Thermogemmatispora carboxidivorans]|uniref:hypothetical protein n=1 Tax=Thermogemmatispora carboxidivorans TaxID=1382306 RepID=UPI00069A8990|nr:hypothetical protein [Thermogemmatispora carboxidivorans]